MSRTCRPCTDRRSTAKKAFNDIKMEMQHCNSLGVKVYCVQYVLGRLPSRTELGADVSLGAFYEFDEQRKRYANVEAAVRRVATQINRLLKAVPTVKLALENMVHNNTGCGRDTHHWSLQELKRVIDLVGDSRAMLCIDICHAYITDYDFNMLDGVKAMNDFIDDVGTERIACIHVSNSSTRHGGTCEGHTQ